MNKFLVAFCAFLIIVTGFLWVKVNTLESQVTELKKPGLYESMTMMQTIIHKISYAIEHENSDLLDFYIHELEELTEDLIEAEMVYHGEEVSILTETMLEPVIEDLEDALESGDWERIREKNQVVIRACNNCHVSTGYPSIIVTERAESNPYNQDFSIRN